MRREAGVRGVEHAGHAYEEGDLALFESGAIGDGAAQVACQRAFADQLAVFTGKAQSR